MAEMHDDEIRRAYADERRYLESAPPEALVAEGEQQLLAAFRRAAAEVPAYRQLLRDEGVQADQIDSVEAFLSRVPVIDKDWAFGKHRLRDLCAGGDIEGVSRVYSSSGYSGTFSFGMDTVEEPREAAVGLEFLLDRAFAALERRTFLINCLSMGVTVYTRTLPVAETSVRSDVVRALIRELADDFEQFILIGEHLFLKKVLEEGREGGVPWKDLTVHVVMGGEFIAENTRAYFAHVLGIDFDDPDAGRIFLNMGLSELGISIFRDEDNLGRIRRAAQTDPALHAALFGEETGVCPEILQYDPRHYYVESHDVDGGEPRIVVSVLDPRRKLPLLRYNTKDSGSLLGYDDLVAVLNAHGYGSLAPRFHLPVALLRGRKQQVRLSDGGVLSTAHVKEALYADADVARRLTGFFRIEQDADATTVRVQARPDVEPGPDLAAALETSLRRYVDGAFAVQVVGYEAFPYGVVPDYERKARYI
jgi:phenylacetate-CoA ligase